MTGRYASRVIRRSGGRARAHPPGTRRGCAMGLDPGRFVLGSELAAFEVEFCSY
jgi:hypothetical protein